MNAVDDSSTQLWHMQLVHMSQNGMRMLFKKMNILILKSTDLEACTHCLTRKQRRVSFKMLPLSRKANVLDLVHTDICSMDAMSFGGAR